MGLYIQSWAPLKMVRYKEWTKISGEKCQCPKKKTSRKLENYWSRLRRKIWQSEEKYEEIRSGLGLLNTTSLQTQIKNVRTKDIKYGFICSSFVKYANLNIDNLDLRGNRKLPSDGYTHPTKPPAPMCNFISRRKRHHCYISLTA